MHSKHASQCLRYKLGWGNRETELAVIENSNFVTLQEKKYAPKKKKKNPNSMKSSHYKPGVEFKSLTFRRAFFFSESDLCGHVQDPKARYLRLVCVGGGGAFYLLSVSRRWKFRTCKKFACGRWEEIHGFLLRPKEQDNEGVELKGEA